MGDTTDDSTLFDVEAEYRRLIKNAQEMYNKNILSISSGRKVAERIRRWRKQNLHLQSGTTP